MSREDFIADYCMGDEEIYEAFVILANRGVHPDDYEALWSLKDKLPKKDV